MRQNMWTATDVFRGSQEVTTESCTQNRGRHVNALTMLRWLEARMQEIPAQYHATAELRTPSDSGAPFLTLSYVRPMTSEESQAAAAAIAPRQALQRTAELKQLAELQAKYGDSPIVDM